MTTMESVGARERHPLDNPVWASLSGAHAHLAEIKGSAGRYQADVAPFVALSDDPDEGAWADLAALVGPGTEVALTGAGLAAPDGWEVRWHGSGVQLVATELEPAPAPDAIVLGPDDAPEMLDLVARTEPGPFRPRTVEMGRYLGIRDGGRLVAMAGERLRPPGWTEISAVCTDAAYRGRGLATRLVRAVAAGIVARGDRPFLHAAASNTNAIRLYHSIGFTLRREPSFLVVRAPG
jgi:ribosomal protein S18 acetylase RimI-like enzyme